MRIESDWQGGCLHMSLLGELDHHCAESTLSELELTADRFMPRSVSLNLSGLSFMDSSGIAVILRLNKRMQQTDGRIWVEDPSPQVMRVLAASGVGRIVPIRYTERRAAK